MTASKPCPPRPNLDELIRHAQKHFDALTPSQKLRYRYMQRRSWARHHANTDKHMPHEATLTDTQIGLILAGEPLA